MQADIISAAVDQDERHILSCLPTGMGKTLPMLIASQLLPPGNFLWSCAYYKLQCVLSRFNDNDCRSSHHHQASAGGRLSEAWLFSSRRRPGTARLTWKCTPPPLTSPPRRPPVSFCFSALVSQHQPEDFERQLLKRPPVLIVSAEFLASTVALSK